MRARCPHMAADRCQCISELPPESGGAGGMFLRSRRPRSAQRGARDASLEQVADQRARKHGRQGRLQDGFHAGRVARAAERLCPPPRLSGVRPIWRPPVPRGSSLAALGITLGIECAQLCSAKLSNPVVYWVPWVRIPRGGGNSGGEGGIRTHGPREGTPVFKTGAFNRSATSPGDAECARKLLQRRHVFQPFPALPACAGRVSFARATWEAAWISGMASR
jgi:hypothetical protein